MGLKQVMIKKGHAIVDNVPSPQVNDDSVLVKVHCSCISIGTEMSGVRGSGEPLWKKAMKKPDKVKKVLTMAMTEGIGKTQEIVKGKLESGAPTGYSAAGEVIAVGKNIRDIKVGERVACAGAQCAHHAEVINVPRNLMVKIPEGVSYRDAAPVTLGSIAMQGVRRANTTLGETFVVIGLGVIGQIVVQLLKASGCKVIASDLDKSRIDMAIKHGADMGIHPDGGVDIDQVMRLTSGIGADGVIITAASHSSAIVSTAFKMCRRKGRVILVGDVGLDLKRADFYQKELDFLISTSYGPGRYDSLYEEKGLEYPVSYVRWTENRNLQEVLALVKAGKLDFKDMVQAIYPIAQATEAYEMLKTASPKPLMVLLDYPENKAEEETVISVSDHKPHEGKIHVAVIGAGGFAKGMHLPNLQKLDSMFEISAIMSRTGSNAENTAKQFGARYATTDYKKILDDKSIDMVIITTRHNLHAGMVLQALQAGKHVLVEKPLAITESELEQIEQYAKNNPDMPLLLTGFNRRHSKYLQEIGRVTSKRVNPMIINYRMNAGYIPLDHWVHTEEGAGRNIGEATHIYDVFNFLTGAKAVSVSATSITPKNGYYSSKDNFTVVIEYEDGSVANLIYTALGSKAYPKEQMDIYFDDKVITLNDYKTMQGFGVKLKAIQTKGSEKGQLEELKALGEAIRQGKDAPTPLWQQMQSMRIAFAVEQQI